MFALTSYISYKPSWIKCSVQMELHSSVYGILVLDLADEPVFLN